MERAILKVPSIHDDAGIYNIKAGLNRLRGIQRIEGDVGRKTITVEFEPASVDIAAIKQTVEERGFPVERLEEAFEEGGIAPMPAQPDPLLALIPDEAAKKQAQKSHEKTRRSRNVVLGAATLAIAVAVAAVALLNAAGKDQSGALPTSVPTPMIVTAPKVGNLAPDFTLTNLEGKTVSLSELRGKPVILYFWSLTCPGCAKTMPTLEKIYQEGGGAFEVLVIHFPINKQDLVKWMEKNDKKFSYPLFIDTSSSILIQYQVLAPVTTYFIDRTGVIRAWHDGTFGVELAEEKIREYLKTIL